MSSPAPDPRLLLPPGLGPAAAGTALAVLLPLAVLVQGRAHPTALDDAVHAFSAPRPPLVDDLLDAAARLLPPSMPLVGAALAVACWRRGGRRAAVLCLLGPAAASVTTAVLKPLLARPSGSGEGWMFPSGHMTAVAAVAVVAAVLLLPHGVLGRALGRRRTAALALAAAVPLLTAVGTVLRRYHHLTDVVGALLVATLAVLTVAALLDRLPFRARS